MNQTQKEITNNSTELITRLKSLLETLSKQDIENRERYYEVISLTQKILNNHKQFINTPWWSI